MAEPTSSPSAADRLAQLSPPERLEHLHRVLREAVATSGSERLLVITHRSPDPDALGSCCGLRFLLEHDLEIPVQVATVGRIHRAENLAMVRELALDFDDFSGLDLSDFAGALLVDSQPGFGHTPLPEGLPLLAVFDHHRSPESGAAQAARVPHFDVRQGVGATSSIVFEYIELAGLQMDEHTASALFCGVRFDTADLAHNLTPLDERAYFTTLRHADRPLVARIQKPELPIEYYREFHRALNLSRRYGPLVIGLLGTVGNPESVAEMADFFLRMEGCHWTFTGGAYEGVYYISLRSDYTYGPAYELLEFVLENEGSFGGHGRIAGGQVPLKEGDDVEVRQLQRRLRSRGLALMEREGLLEGDERQGLSLA